jgi:hypothetical protein
MSVLKELTPLVSLFLGRKVQHPRVLSADLKKEVRILLVLCLLSNKGAIAPKHHNLASLDLVLDIDIRIDVEVEFKGLEIRVRVTEQLLPIKHQVLFGKLAISPLKEDFSCMKMPVPSFHLLSLYILFLIKESYFFLSGRVDYFVY